MHEDNAPVTSVRFSPNGKFVLAWTLDSCIRLWNYIEGRCVKTYQGHTNVKFSLSGAFGTYGRDDDRDEPLKAFIVSGSEDGGMVWWDVQSKAVLQKEEAEGGGHEGVVLGVDTGGEGLVVSGGVDRTVRVWERVGEEVEEEEEEDEGEDAGMGVGSVAGEEDQGDEEDEDEKGGQ